MKTMTASNASKNFGGYIDTARREPVIVTRQNRPVAVTMSIEEAEALMGGQIRGKITSAVENKNAEPKTGRDLLKNIHDRFAEIGGADDLVEAMKGFPNPKIGDPLSFSE